MATRHMVGVKPAGLPGAISLDRFPGTIPGQSVESQNEEKTARHFARMVGNGKMTLCEIKTEGRHSQNCRDIFFSPRMKTQKLGCVENAALFASTAGVGTGSVKTCTALPKREIPTTLAICDMASRKSSMTLYTRLKRESAKFATSGMRVCTLTTNTERESCEAYSVEIATGELECFMTTQQRCCPRGNI